MFSPSQMHLVITKYLKFDTNVNVNQLTLTAFLNHLLLFREGGLIISLVVPWVRRLEWASVYAFFLEMQLLVHCEYTEAIFVGFPVFYVSELTQLTNVYLLTFKFPCVLWHSYVLGAVETFLNAIPAAGIFRGKSLRKMIISWLVKIPTGKLPLVVEPSECGFSFLLQNYCYLSKSWSCYPLATGKRSNVNKIAL